MTPGEEDLSADDIPTEDITTRRDLKEGEVANVADYFDVPLQAVFTEEFMREYTEFGSIGEFFAESPWTIEEEDDLNQIPVNDLDDYVSEHTEFLYFDHMKKQASVAFSRRHLGL